MRYLARSLASFALVAGLATSALAQGEGGRPEVNFKPETFRLVMPDGKVVEKKMTDQHMKEMMANGAMPMTAGVIMMMHDGKMYMVQDKKMPNGKMLSDVMMEH